VLTVVFVTLWIAVLNLLRVSVYAYLTRKREPARRRLGSEPIRALDFELGLRNLTDFAVDSAPVEGASRLAQCRKRVAESE
jgi:hypothetical protein